MAQITEEPIKLPDHDHVKLAQPGIGQHPIKPRSPVRRASDLVRVFTDKLPLSPPDILGQLARLHGHVLPVRRRNPAINYCPHLPVPPSCPFAACRLNSPAIFPTLYPLSCWTVRL